MPTSFFALAPCFITEGDSRFAIFRKEAEKDKSFPGMRPHAQELIPDL
jgi:hypothetical protein